MSQSLVQCLQALGNIVLISCAIRSRDEDGRPVCVRSCFFLSLVRFAVESLSHSLGRAFARSSSG